MQIWDNITEKRKWTFKQSFHQLFKMRKEKKYNKMLTTERQLFKILSGMSLKPTSFLSVKRGIEHH